MTRWLAFRTLNRVLGVVEAPDLDTARLEAWARWGTSVDRVQSEASCRVARQERLSPPQRRVNDDEEDGS